MPSKTYIAHEKIQRRATQHPAHLRRLVRLLACRKLEVPTVLVVRVLGDRDLAPEVGGKEGV